MPGVTTDTLVSSHLVQDGSRNFYPLRIPMQHNQLRHFISASTSKCVYFAVNRRIYALGHGKRRKLASVKFDIQCLAAGHGWICVGSSKNGGCAFLRMKEEEGSRAEVDAILPLELGQYPSRRVSTEEDRRSREWYRNPVSHIYYKDVGKDIVNSITIQEMPKSETNNKKEVVALLANNDATITLYSLSQMQAVHIFRILDPRTNEDIPMNHASMSGDGESIIAVGDHNIVHFYTRLAGKPQDRTNAGYEDFSWEVRATFVPKNFAKKNRERGDHAFTTAFSPTGKICLVASQSGHVAIYNTAALREGATEHVARLTTYESSRPFPSDGFANINWWRGAVRSIAFSPSTWDMIAWAEDQGRICVADLRNVRIAPQVVEIDLKSKDLETVEVPEVSEHDQSRFPDVDNEAEAAFHRQHREASEAHYYMTAVNTVADYMEYTAARRRDGQPSRPLDSTYFFNPEERRVLDSIRRETLRSGRDGSNDGTSTPMGHWSLNNPEDRVVQYRHANTGRVSNNDSNDEGQSSTSRIYGTTPRRRSSVILSHEPSNTNSNTGTTSTSTLAPMISNSNFSQSPSRLPDRHDNNQPRQTSTLPPLTSTTGGSDPWQTISAAMETSRATTPSANNGASSINFSRSDSSLNRSLRDLQQTQDALEHAQGLSLRRTRVLEQEIARQRERYQSSHRGDPDRSDASAEQEEQRQRDLHQRIARQAGRDGLGRTDLPAPGVGIGSAQSRIPAAVSSSDGRDWPLVNHVLEEARRERPELFDASSPRARTATSVARTPIRAEPEDLTAREEALDRSLRMRDAWMARYRATYGRDPPIAPTGSGSISASTPTPRQRRRASVQSPDAADDEEEEEATASGEGLNTGWRAFQARAMTASRADIERLARIRGQQDVLGETSVDDIDYLRQFLRPDTEEYTINDGGFVGRQHGSGSGEADIMGLTWSWDGRLIYVATTEGIVELKVNLRCRNTFGATSMQ